MTDIKGSRLDGETLSLVYPISRKSPEFDRATKRLLARLARDGDHCHGCRRPYQDRDRSTVGRDAAGKVWMVGDCCRGRLVTILATSLYFRPRPSEPWAADDRDWFAAHPDRSHRLRAAYPGEWPPAQATPYTIVKQRRPGVRQRLGIRITAELLELGEPPEEAVWAMFDLATEAAENGTGRVLTADIVARYRLLASVARA